MPGCFQSKCQSGGSDGWKRLQRASDDGTGNPVILDNSGNQVYPQLIDRYGNYFSANGNGDLVDDTGQIPVVVTQNVNGNANVTWYEVLAPNGPINNNGTCVRYIVTTAPVSVVTNFGQSDVYEWNPSNPIPILFSSSLCCECVRPAGMAGSKAAAWLMTELSRSQSYSGSVYEVQPEWLAKVFCEAEDGVDGVRRLGQDEPAAQGSDELPGSGGGLCDLAGAVRRGYTAETPGCDGA